MPVEAIVILVIVVGVAGFFMFKRAKTKTTESGLGSRPDNHERTELK